MLQVLVSGVRLDALTRRASAIPTKPTVEVVSRAPGAL